MDKILIFILAALTAFNFSGVATFIYLIWLWTGFVKTEWITLSSFTALLVYWFYGLFGLVFLTGTLISSICALAMFWFDMSIQDLQEKAHDSVNEVRPEDEKVEASDDNVGDSTTLLDLTTEQVRRRTGLSEAEFEEKMQEYLNKYQNVSERFNEFYETAYSSIVRARELTDEIPFIALAYYYFDYFWNELNTYCKAIISLKELSKLSRAGFGDPNGQPDFSALQNIDMSALLGGLGAMGMGPDVAENTGTLGSNQANSQSARNINPSNPPLGGMTFPPMSGMGGMGGFDMSKMAELERTMTPAQKQQAEQAAMNMLQNFDMSQMGDMMSMFGGMGAPANNANTSATPNQNLTRAQKRRLKKLQKKGK